MVKVRVRFDIADATKTLRLEGEAKEYPVIGNDWSFSIRHDESHVQVDLGRILNMESFGDMLLVQTNLTVAEVWLLDGSNEPNQASTNLVGINRLRRAINKVDSVMRHLKDEVAAQRRSTFRLIKED